MTTTLILLSSKGRAFRAEACIPATDLPTMRPKTAIVGYIVKSWPDNIGTPIANLRPSTVLMSYIK